MPDIKDTRRQHPSLINPPTRGDDGGVRLEPVKLEHGLGAGRLREEDVRRPHALLRRRAHLVGFCGGEG